MANEYSISSKATISKGGITVLDSGAFNITMSGDDMLHETQVIGTSAEAITWGEITGVPAWVFIKNLDSTNFVLVGWTNPPTEIKLLAGQTASFPTSTATMYAIADTAAVRIAKLAGEA